MRGAGSVLPGASAETAEETRADRPAEESTEHLRANNEDDGRDSAAAGGDSALRPAAASASGAAAADEDEEGYGLLAALDDEDEDEEKDEDDDHRKFSDASDDSYDYDDDDDDEKKIETFGFEGFRSASAAASNSVYASAMSRSSAERFGSSLFFQSEADTSEEEEEEGDGNVVAAAAAAGATTSGANASANSALFSSVDLPPNLHPAASLGMRRVSSMAYFSIGSMLDELGNAMESPSSSGGPSGGGGRRGSSNADLLGLGLASAADKREAKPRAKDRCEADPTAATSAAGKASDDVDIGKDTAGGVNDTPRWNAVDVLYHDVMMRVFAYLPLRSLASFSETSRRANFETFYFLQLQLQGALLDGGISSSSESSSSSLSSSSSSSLSDDGLTPLAGTGAVVRLASMDADKARDVVRSYLESTNSALESMPLSHSLAYLRRALLRHGFHMPGGGGGGGGEAAGAAHNGARAAALAVTLLGAASYVHSHGGPAAIPAEMMSHVPHMSEEFSVALRDGLLKIGLAGGLMRAGAEVAAKVQEGHHHGGEGDDEHGNDDDGTNSTHTSNGNGAVGVAAQMRETAEQVARMLQGHFPRAHRAQHLRERSGDGDGEEGDSAEEDDSFPSSIAARLYGAFASAHGSTTPVVDDAAPSSSTTGTPSSPRRRRHRGQRSRYRPNGDATTTTMADTSDEDREEAGANAIGDIRGAATAASASSAELPSPAELRAMERPAGPDPYTHEIIAIPEDEEGSSSASGSDADDEGRGAANDRGRRNNASSAPSSSKASKSKSEQKPSGCVGAYVRSVKSAADAVTALVRAKRKSNFESFPEDQRTLLSTRFIDACSSDDTLDVVRELVSGISSEKGGVIDPDGFYVGSDGAETCGLHAAAFHGAAEVVRLLTAPVDTTNVGGGGGGSSTPEYLDGGACDPNLRDGNGWTAAHFAAGADEPDVLRVLSERGADLSIEASNGYTPYHWAERLSNERAAAVLGEAGADRRFLEMRWMFGGGNSNNGGGGGNGNGGAPVANQLLSAIFSW